jgi:pimeloyl-ACP methyl ester carboxylesterase
VSEIFFTNPSHGAPLAYRKLEPKIGEPTLVWLGGFHSDMGGTKALHIWSFAAEHGLGCMLFDYFGQGVSHGEFCDGTISHWRDDALHIIDTLTTGRVILVGSSMGAWIALLVGVLVPSRIGGLCLIAPAPDFTQDLMWDIFPATVQEEILETGRWLRPSEYGSPYPITAKLINDGRTNLVLTAPIIFDGPVRILHGQCDADAPWARSLLLLEKLNTDNARLTLVKAGDHRLSSASDLDLLTATLTELVATISRSQEI